MTFCLSSWTCCRLGSSKVLTVQVVHTDLLQFVHFRYCRSPSLIHQPARARKVDLWWVYSQFCWFALSFCMSLLCKSMQSSLFLRHAAKGRDMGFVFGCSKLWWTLERRKIGFTAGTREQLCFPPLPLPVAAMLRHLNLRSLPRCCLSRCFQVDDFTISILDKMKEIAQYPSAIRQMLWAATHLSDCTSVCRYM